MNSVQRHYETHPYPHYPLLARIRRCDTYAISLEALWCRFNGAMPPPEARSVLVAGCGSFSPYPFSLANPGCRVTALDLSAASLRRARLHCLLNLRRNVDFLRGDLLDGQLAPGPFGLIDAFGVLHHLPDPGAGLRALATRLAPGGIMRVMLYSHGARTRTEAARRALRRLGVQSLTDLKRLLKGLPEGSSLATAVAEAPDAAFDSGLADAFLHPLVQTFTVAQLETLLAATGLRPLLFAHAGALPDPSDELARLRTLERTRNLDSNYLLFLGRDTCGPARPDAGALVSLNPCLSGILPRIPRPAGRLGHPLPPLDGATRKLLRRCRTPQPWETLSVTERQLARKLAEHLLLLISNTRQVGGEVDRSPVKC